MYFLHFDQLTGEERADCFAFILSHISCTHQILFPPSVGVLCRLWSVNVAIPEPLAFYFTATRECLFINPCKRSFLLQEHGLRPENNLIFKRFVGEYYKI